MTGTLILQALKLTGEAAVGAAHRISEPILAQAACLYWSKMACHWLGAALRSRWCDIGSLHVLSLTMMLQKEKQEYRLENAREGCLGLSDRIEGVTIIDYFRAVHFSALNNW